MAIKTEGGGKLYIKPSPQYSEDFERYESLSVESSSDDDDSPLSQVQLAAALCCSWQYHLKYDCAQGSASKPSIVVSSLENFALIRCDKRKEKK